ncbi:hypothetical protein L7F22_035117 [Adiantum nelumboides]|nr:hypothetical protein [Adiantum nelumboides]
MYFPFRQEANTKESMLNSSATSNLLETNSTAARPFPTGFSSQLGSTPIFPHTGNIPGLHNVHGNYNMSTVPSSLSSRNSGLGAAPGGPVHQPSGGLSTGRFANNTSLSQISHAGLHGRTGLNAGATGAFSGSMNGAVTPVSGPSPGVNSRGTVSGLGVSPSMIGTGGPRITSSVSSMISGGVGSGLSRNLNSGTGINIPSFSGSRVNLGPSNMNGGLSIQGPGRPINNILQQASPQMVSILGNNFSSSVGSVGQGQSQATANGQLTSMGLMNDADGAAFDLNDFPQLSTRPSSAGSQGGLASLRKQVGVNPIVQQSQEFSIQNEDFPALPGFKGGSSDYSADVHQKDSQHESALALMQSQQFGITERINDVSFRLRLPDTWKIHNAFHVSLLKPFRGDVPDDGEPDEQPKVEENEEILVPEHILAHKDTKTKGKVRRRFLVKFKNYPALDAKWMEEEDLADTPQIVKLYLEAFGLA